MKAIKDYFPVLLFVMLYKVVLIFESMNEILNVTSSFHSFILLNTSFSRRTCKDLCK